MLHTKLSFKKMLLTIGLLSIAPLSHADLLISDYQAAKKNPQQMVMTKMQLHSMFEGISYASLDIENKGQKGIFCPPPKLKVTQDNLVMILDNQILLFETVMKDKGGLNKNLPVASVLLTGLRGTFPCK